MRIAVVGTGIAGNAAAFALSKAHHISKLVVYERDIRIGGHTNTLDIHYDGAPVSVDTGFIVYNETNYPLLTRLFDFLGVETIETDMGFSYSLDGGKREWAGVTHGYVNAFFARRRNILSPRHWRMLFEMRRFTRICAQALNDDRFEGLSLGAFLKKHRFSAGFCQDYVIPMGAAIWSTPLEEMLAFPAKSFVRFFDNHKLLDWNRPIWRTVKGGSRNYLERMTAGFRRHIRIGSPVVNVRREKNHVVVTDANGQQDEFDHVILACHSDQSLAILGDASPAERSILEDVKYQPNTVFLHRDHSLMPRRKRAWAAWNVQQSSKMNGAAPVSVTYWMNKLQGIDEQMPLFVSLNPLREPSHETIFARLTYDHPQFDTAALDAQGRLADVQGKNHIWFAGAWTANGFHEDGIRSGFEVAQALGAALPWDAEIPRKLEAAE
jgi:uncharacterized protein